MDRRMELLTTGRRNWGCPATKGQVDQFETYFRELSDGNRRANLTAITSYDDVQVKHYLDSLTLVLAVGADNIPGAAVMDLGAGAGFPGLAVKIVFPTIQLALADSVRKKTRFMERLVDTLGFTGVSVHTGRAEELARRRGLRASFDLTLARGVARLPTLLEYALPFCRPGGRVVAWKHDGIDDELAAAARVSPLLGGGPPAVHPVTLTGLTDRRILVVVDKVAETPVEFPRRTGIPAKQPLTGGWG